MNIYRYRLSQAGFTFIEIIAVLLIVGVMAAIAVSRSSSGDADLIADADTLKTHLRFAQMKAMITNTTWGIKFNGNTYALQENGATSGSFLPGADGASFALSSGTSATATVDPISFDDWGSPGNSAITVTISKGGSSRSFTVTKNTGFIP